MRDNDAAHFVVFVEHDGCHLQLLPQRDQHAPSSLGHPPDGFPVSSPLGLPPAQAAKIQIEGRSAAVGSAVGRVRLGLRPDLPAGGAAVSSAGIDRPRWNGATIGSGSRGWWWRGN